MKSSAGLEKKPQEKWLQWRLENIPQVLTFRRLNEDKPLKLLKISLLWWEAGLARLRGEKPSCSLAFYCPFSLSGLGPQGGILGT